jgi:hypothetical protein
MISPIGILLDSCEKFKCLKKAYHINFIFFYLPSNFKSSTFGCRFEWLSWYNPSASKVFQHTESVYAFKNTI